MLKRANVGVARPDRTPLYLGFVGNICKKVRNFIFSIWISLKQFILKIQGTNKAEKATELFEQEALRLNDLGKHNQIPQLLGYLTQEKSQYLVQKYIDGHNLAQILAKQGTFKEQQIWELLNSLLPVLEFIHSHDVIHRNIKPENIILSKDGKLFLVNFSVANVVMDTAILKTVTNIGNSEFFAPEQNRGKAIYIKCVTAYELLSKSALSKTPK
ncbi:protein kinase domain-containing protein [Calothrix sp. CCY 0018]|uniref:protein kinase domain-containing protein n=1 Tax=Calothrix sp. CCY 0018 TaxID=3103864 RepID=UPI0039C73354